MSAALNIPTDDAPASVTVIGPGSPATWRAPGKVVERALYSILVEWTYPTGQPGRAWFNWHPAYAQHGRMHGVDADFATRVEAAEC